MDAWIAYDNYVLTLMTQLKEAADAACGCRTIPALALSTPCGKVPSVGDKVRELTEAIATKSQPILKTFDDVAQVDLDLSSHKVCRPAKDFYSPPPWQVPWSCT